MQAYSILSKKEDPTLSEAPRENSGILERPGIPRIIRKLAARSLLVMISRSALTRPITGVVSVTGKVILWQVRSPVLVL